MRHVPRAALLSLAFSACGGGVDPREITVANTIVDADLPVLRTRPQLVVGKYARMAGDVYSFFRGTFPLFMRDAHDTRFDLARSAFEVDGAFPFGLGDAHPENFGILVASDESFAIEPNDFDGADRYPYLWDIRRLVTGMVVATRLSNADDPPARDAAVAAQGAIARAVGAGYAAELVRLADGGAPMRFEDGAGNPFAEDLFRRGRRDWEGRDELAELTVLEDGRRRLLRGGIDPEDPSNVYLDLPPFVLEALPDVVSAYRTSLLEPPEAGFFEILDAARELGSGVASYPRVRIILLVRGETSAPEDDVILELKELIDSGAEGYVPPGVSFDSVPERVIGTSRRLWFRPDAEPLWGVSDLFGLPVQLKRESEAFKTVRTRRFEEEEGTPEAIEGFAGQLGALVARLHVASGPELTSAIAAVIRGNEEAFAEEQATVGLAYADQVFADHQHFLAALERLGPLLGLPLEPTRADRPTPEMEALFGTPPVTP
ncbi:MAG: DUF2252 family protein [Polyangiaceae bacterium]